MATTRLAAFSDGVLAIAPRCSSSMCAPPASRLGTTTRSFRPGIPLYLGSTLIAFASPAVSVSLYVALAAFYVLESSVFARSGARR